MHRFLIAAVICSLAAMPTSAKPFSPKNVSNDASWFAHADVESLKTTELGRQLMTLVNKNSAQMDALWAMTKRNLAGNTAVRSIPSR